MNRILGIVSFLLFSCINSFAQQIPNNSFESWVGNKPDFWNTSNQNILGLVDFTMVTKDITGPQQGSASAKLTVVTKSIPFAGTYSLPGVLTLGILNYDLVNQTASVSGGAPFTGLPEKLTGYFKYQPVNNDNCALGWGLTRWKNGVRDTIGFGATAYTNTYNTWTYFEIPLIYKILEAPDTMNILFLNSNPLDGATHTGTTMWVDNLSFVYGTVGIEGITFSKELTVYAESDSRQLVVTSSFVNPEKLDISLYSMAGMEVRHWNRTMQASTERLGINNLSPGTYVIRISTEKRMVDTRKITIFK